LQWGCKLIKKSKYDHKIYENSIFPAYVPEKNKIITPWPIIKKIVFENAFQIQTLSKIYISG
jgi:hypothetical protein